MDQLPEMPANLFVTCGVFELIQELPLVLVAVLLVFVEALQLDLRYREMSKY